MARNVPFTGVDTHTRGLKLIFQKNWLLPLCTPLVPNNFVLFLVRNGDAVFVVGRGGNGDDLLVDLDALLLNVGLCISRICSHFENRTSCIRNH